MKLAIATDHAGFDFKEGLRAYLGSEGHEVLDLGTHDLKSVDYPDYAKLCCEAVLEKKVQFGILVCGSGIGMSIAANRFHGIRAAACHDLYTSRMSRSHNDANVMVLPSRMIALTIAKEMVDLFLATPFEGGRHIARLQKIETIC
jgi:ribose 5-phosphate isomerase B